MDAIAIRAVISVTYIILVERISNEYWSIFRRSENVKYSHKKQGRIHILFERKKCLILFDHSPPFFSTDTETPLSN